MGYIPRTQRIHIGICIARYVHAAAYLMDTMRWRYVRVAGRISILNIKVLQRCAKSENSTYCYVISFPRRRLNDGEMASPPPHPMLGSAAASYDPLAKSRLFYARPMRLVGEMKTAVSCSVCLVSILESQYLFLSLLREFREKQHSRCLVVGDFTPNSDTSPPNTLLQTPTLLLPFTPRFSLLSYDGQYTHSCIPRVHDSKGILVCSPVSCVPPKF
jgi:hypothetical protein